MLLDMQWKESGRRKEDNMSNKYDYKQPFRKKVNIMGTIYTCIFEKEDSNPKYGICGCDGYCDYSVKEVHVALLEPTDRDQVAVENYYKAVMRHEIVHAFLYESGLHVSSGRVNCWAQNEEMVDWIALQFPKIAKVYRELNILD